MDIIEVKMKRMNFKIDLEPVEDRNPALTRHAILKTPHASWSHSVFSVPFSEKIIPNRDYPYEGLSVVLQGENFHFLDGLAIGVKQEKGREKRYIPLVAEHVQVSPWEMRYAYRADEVRLTARYYLMRGEPEQNGCTACVLLETDAGGPYQVIIEPLVDIRHMYEPSTPERHSCKLLPDGMLIERDDNYLSIRATRDCMVRTWHTVHEWWYKLGSGYREKTDGSVVFKGEQRNLVSVGELEISLEGPSTALVILSCSNSEPALEWLSERGRMWMRDEAEEEERAEELVGALGIKTDAVAFRALGLARFGMYTAGKFFYEAGDFWFRTPWFRDQFEGIINNLETLIRMGHAERIKNIIRHSFEYQDSTGRIPNRFPERRGEKLDYNNADATLLAFIAAAELLKRNWDEELANLIVQRAEYTISRFKTNTVNVINGAPVLHENGLVSIVPWHSWTDTKRLVEMNGRKMNVSVRIPDSWCVTRDENDLNKPTYFLPEINAQWIKMLSACVEISRACKTGEETFLALLVEAKSNFKATFWDTHDHILYNLVSLEGQKDRTLGSPAVVAVSLLMDEGLFSRQEVEHFIASVKAQLLVERNGLPFGILVKNSTKRTYYGDAEYHEGVVWPRDTPYLIRLLRYAGAAEQRTVEGLLKSNLIHQMNEGFVFYNSELFSPDNGALVPVKNPVQFWSQWVDPYLEGSF